MTARLQPWLEEEIKEFWARYGDGPSAALRHVAEEWWTYEHCPHLEFRDGVAGRRAALREGPDVWEVVQLLDAYGDLDGVGEHLGNLIAREALQDAVMYYEKFPDETRAWISNNERVGKLLERIR